VLPTNGPFGLIWNIEDYNQARSYPVQTKWAATIRKRMFHLDDTTDDNAPRFRNEKWRAIFAEQSPKLVAGDGGTVLSEDEVRWTSWLKKEDLWKRWRTLSQIAILQGDALQEARTFFDDAVDDPSTQRDQQGRIAVHGVTIVAWARKI
jgi:hypothetical protein